VERCIDAFSAQGYDVAGLQFGQQCCKNGPFFLFTAAKAEISSLRQGVIIRLSSSCHLGRISQIRRAVSLVQGMQLNFVVGLARCLHITDFNCKLTSCSSPNRTPCGFF